ncbi:hypothetical protein [Lysinibacillus sphaericus]|nr:hypothetical protein [Lysinibacillus sphaericus]
MTIVKQMSLFDIQELLAWIVVFLFRMLYPLTVLFTYDRRQ